MTEKPLPLSLRGLPYRRQQGWRPLAAHCSPTGPGAAAGLAEAARGAVEEGRCLGETHLLAG